MLKSCLESILQQNCPEEWQVEIVVIDNDVAQTAKSLITELGKTSTLPLHYFVEASQGIPLARNKGCDESLRLGADWILFIDDDEIAEPDWLVAYYKATHQYNSNVYSGPVRYLFPENYAEWLGNPSGLNTKDGSVKKRAATNNAMVHKSVFVNDGLRFDDNMALTGGSDTDFFIRYYHMDGKIIHVKNAVVSEEVLSNRLKISWRLKRQFRSSANRVYVNKKIYNHSKAVSLAIKECFRHIVEGAIGLILSPLFLLKGIIKFRKKYYHALRHLAKAIGCISGIIDIQPKPYKKTDGF